MCAQDGRILVWRPVKSTWTVVRAFQVVKRFKRSNVLNDQTPAKWSNASNDQTFQMVKRFKLSNAPKNGQTRSNAPKWSNARIGRTLQKVAKRFKWSNAPKTGQIPKLVKLQKKGSSARNGPALLEWSNASNGQTLQMVKRFKWSNASKNGQSLWSVECSRCSHVRNGQTPKVVKYSKWPVVKSLKVDNLKMAQSVRGRLAWGGGGRRERERERDR